MHGLQSLSLADVRGAPGTRAPQVLIFSFSCSFWRKLGKIGWCPQQLSNWNYYCLRSHHWDWDFADEYGSPSWTSCKVKLESKDPKSRDQFYYIKILKYFVVQVPCSLGARKPMSTRSSGKCPKGSHVSKMQWRAWVSISLCFLYPADFRQIRFMNSTKGILNYYYLITKRPMSLIV